MKKIIFFILMLFLVQSANAQISGSVIFSEIAWMGNTNSSSDEWIELKNTSSGSINLNWWAIEAGDWSPTIILSWSISTYFLLERTDESSASWVLADQIYSWSLWNDGEILFLKNSSWEIIDEIGYWLAWDNFTKETMERSEDLSWINWSVNWNPQNSSSKFYSISTEGSWSIVLESTETWTLLQGTWINLTESWLNLSNSWISLSQTWSEQSQEDAFTWEVLISESWSNVSTWWLVLMETWSELVKSVQVEVEAAPYVKVVPNSDYNKLYIEEKEVVVVYKDYKFWDLIISEFVTDPQQDWSAWAFKYPWSWKIDSQDEWIEFYNTTNLDIDLENWSLLMQDSSPSELIFKPAIIKSHSYFVYWDIVWSMNNNIKIILNDANWNLINEFDLTWDIDWNASSLNNESVSLMFDLDKIVKTKASPWRINIFNNVSPTALIKVQWNWKTIWTWTLNVNITWEDSFDPDFDEIDFYWDFWDWDTATWANPISHKYSVWDFILKLEVKDNWWNIWNSLLNIKVNKLLAKEEVKLEIKKVEEKIINKKIVTPASSIKKPQEQVLKEATKTSEKLTIQDLQIFQEKIWDLDADDLDYFIKTSTSETVYSKDNYIWKIEKVSSGVVYFEWWMSFELFDENDLLSQLMFKTWAVVSIWDDWNFEIIDIPISVWGENVGVLDFIIDFILDFIAWFGW